MTTEIDIRIVEVGPRDGLQNEKSILSTEAKLKYIKLLSETGLSVIEITSFVNASSIVQMADAKILFPKVLEIIKDKSISLPCLVPNMKGYENAKKAGVREISLFTATSSEFTKKNINCSVDESFEKMKSVAKAALVDGMKIRGYISTAFGCPYVGEMNVETLITVSKRFFDLGVYEISIGDTIGQATPKLVDSFLMQMRNELPFEKIAMHFHDTNGRALDNIEISLNHGIKVFDASSGGLGGCPYAEGATGNISTEKVVKLLNSKKLRSGVDLSKLEKASTFILSKIG